MTCWCRDDNLFLNVSETNEMIMDFGKKQERNYHPLRICGEEGGQLQIPQCLHHRGLIMVKTLQAAPQGAKDFLYLHRRERPDGQLYQQGLSGPAEGGAVS